MILQVKKRQQGEIADAAHKKNVTSGDLMLKLTLLTIWYKDQRDKAQVCYAVLVLFLIKYTEGSTMSYRLNEGHGEGPGQAIERKYIKVAQAVRFL